MKEQGKNRTRLILKRKNGNACYKPCRLVTTCTTGKVEFKNVLLGESKGKATMVYTMYDHFGLDWEDVQKFGDYPIVGDGFKAWYILQHYRSAKPFITEVKLEYPVELSF